MKSYKSYGGGASSPLQILVNGVLTPVGIDTANPANTVAIPFKPTAIPVATVELDTATTNVTNAAFTTLIASTAAYFGEIELINKTGIPMELAIGAPGSEVVKFDISPDGLSRQAINLAAGSRISLKAAQAITTDAGLVILNAFA